MSEELIEELALAIKHGLAWDVEKDVYAAETCIEERRCIAARLLPIIRRRELEAGEKVKDAAEFAFVAPGVWTAPWKVIRALDVAAIIGDSHD